MANGPVDRDEVNSMAKHLRALGNLPDIFADTKNYQTRPESSTIAPAAAMVTSESISEMAKFMKALTGDPATVTAAPSPLRVYHDEDSPLYELQNPAKKDEILSKFYTAATNVLAEAPFDRALRESLVIEKTDTGARIGSWEIVEYKNGKRKSYDVRHKDTRECIASELMLYDAACGLARALNEGYFINTTEVLELLESERNYSSAVNDMILYKHHLKKNPKSNKATLYETRFNEAKRKALQARSRVSVLSETF